MIKEIPCYTIVCDNCGKDSNENSEHACWTDKESAEDIALDSNFEKVGGKHYCDNCYSYDEDDKVILKPSTL